MKERLIGGAVATLALVVAQGFSGTAQAAACAVAPGVSYALWANTPFTCTITDPITTKTFSNFTFGSSTGLTAGNFTVFTDPTPPANSAGLEFTTGSLVAPPNADAAIGFTVTTAGNFLNDADLAIVGSVTGMGTITVGETLIPGSGGTFHLQQSFPSSPNDVGHVVFTPTDTVTAIKNESAIAFTGVSSLSIIREDFSEVPIPEPTTLALLASGLVGLGWFGRRRGKRM